jgi:prophage maintenance system killer protein
MITFLTDEEVIAINLYVIREFSSGEQAGENFSNLLNPVMNWPKQSAFGEEAYPSIFEKAAELFESLAQNHAFHNANKRTVLLFWDPHSELWKLAIKLWNETWITVVCWVTILFDVDVFFSRLL